MVELEALCEGLNTQQRKAVCASIDPGKSLLVIAGAGSGKTGVLTRRIAYLCGRLPPQSIAALTFTRDAAGEMRSRVQKLLEERGMIASSLPFIGTFHSLAWKMLRENPCGAFNWRRAGFQTEPRLAVDTRDRGGDATRKKPEAEDVTTRKNHKPESENAEVPGIKSEKGAGTAMLAVPRSGTNTPPTEELNMEDLIPYVLGILKTFPEVRQHYRGLITHWLVDEFQDTNTHQIQMVQQLLGPRGNFLCVGDDDQSIYGFRGADFKNFNNMVASMNTRPGALLHLTHNYRSTPKVIAFANTILKKKSKTLRKNMVASRVCSHPLFLENREVTLHSHHSQQEEAFWLTSEIRSLARHFRDLTWADFAVLVRLNRQIPYYREALEHHLEEAGRKISVTTYHGAKGLQYPVVFLPGLQKGILPYRDAGGSPSQLAEERRLFYVGVTRAEYKLYLSYHKSFRKRGKRRRTYMSPFLLQSGSLAQRLKSYIGQYCA